LNILIILLALACLIFVAYRGFSVIVFAPLIAALAVLPTSPRGVLPVFAGIFMERMAGFVKLYFPVFVMGAVFGQLIELSGFARSIILGVVKVIGPKRAVHSVVVVCAILTYGGVSLFVVAFAVYPFGAEMFRLAQIPKRLLPATIALGAFTFTMDALPGSPQIQNLIPTTFFQTNSWAAPRLGVAGGVFMLMCGILYLERERIRAAQREEGYGENHRNEPSTVLQENLPSPWLAITPLILVGVLNRVFTGVLPALYGTRFDFMTSAIFGLAPLEVDKLFGVWAVEAALLVASLFVLAFSFSRVHALLKASLNLALGGAMLAVMNTASEYGFGAVIAALPGFRAISDFLSGKIHNPLVSAAIITNALAGITGSASGGLSIALATMGKSYLQRASAAGISAEVLHRVTAMASGGMDTLPHNGAVITLLMVTGLTHRQSYRGIFAMTLIKTLAVVFVIAFYYAFKIY
jgi:H+/gluconate symporter-like permease